MLWLPLLCGTVANGSMPPFGTPWFTSYAPEVNLTTSIQTGVGSTVRWTSPQHFSAIFGYLGAPVPMTTKGNTVNISMKWRSSGEEKCPASCYSGGNYCQQDECHKTKCQDTTVSCLSGTGDFRIALLDTSHTSNVINNNSWCPEGIGYGDMTACLTKAPFDVMRGYDFRIYPHLTKDAKHEPGQVPCSIYRKSSPNLFGKHPRLGEWGCFGTPLGEWTTLSLRLEVTGTRKFKASMTMNGITYEAEDQLNATDPTLIERIDAVAIGYPNGRHYTYIDMASDVTL